MAHKKANDFDPRQHACEEEAKKIVIDWFKRRNLAVDKDSLYVVWFAYIRRGFKCMVTSHIYKSNFFEITVNKITGEMYCNCFDRFEYFVDPSKQSVPIDIQNDITIV